MKLGAGSQFCFLVAFLSMIFPPASDGPGRGLIKRRDSSGIILFCDD